MKASKFSDAQKAFIVKRGKREFLLRRSALKPGSARRPISTGARTATNTDLTVPSATRCRWTGGNQNTQPARVPDWVQKTLAHHKGMLGSTSLRTNRASKGHRLCREHHF